MIHKTTRSILSVLLAVLLLVTSVPLTPAFADGGAVSLPSESGEGRVLEPVNGVYQIYTADDLKEFAAIVNGTAEGIAQNTSANAKLMKDIVLNEKIEVDDNGTVTNQKDLSEWTPIGTSSGYSGNFNGDGHTISGLYIDFNADYQGLFGYVSTDADNTGTVQNLTVSGSVKGDNYVGGVVGYNRGRVENCHNTGSVTSSGSPVGGVVGYNGGTVKNCYNTGSVSGPDSGNSVGGVVGDNGGTVENCYNTGSVKGDWYVGGVVGWNSSSGTVTNCYNTGAVSGGVDVGGVVGYNSGTVENCYNTGKVTGTRIDDYVGGVGGVVGYNISTVTDCYFLQQGELPGNGDGSGTAGATGLTADQFKDQNSFTSWTDFANTWEIKSIFGRPTLKANAEIGGTANNPYKIFTATQLAAFRDIVNGEDGQAANPNAHAKLMNDINLSSVCSKAKGNWNPIGNIRRPYSGTFDGNGHKIENLYINTTDSGAYNQGLFGYLGTSGDNKGTVQNLTVSGSVSGKNYVGGVVGYNDGGTVTGCIFSGSDSVSGEWYVGGIAGRNNGTVKNCYSTGQVNGSADSNDVGGVVGLNHGTVENCYNTGSVSGKNYVGGVVGYNNGGSVTNSYNTGAGTVTGTGDYVGGVVGDNGSSASVENCYNTGSVSGLDSVGGVAGLNHGSVKNCYNTGKVSGGAGVGGVVGYNSSTVENCYNIGEVSGSPVGGVVGYNDGDSVTNCYFLKTADVNENLSGIGKNEGTSSNVEARTDDAFHSGEVAWLLENGQAEDQTTPVWGQSNLTTPDSWPTLVALDKNAKTVYQVTLKYDHAGAQDKTYYTDDTATPSEQPSRDGYTFDHWDKTEGEGNTITYTAQWTPVADPDPEPEEPPYTGKYSYEVSTSVGDHGSLTVDRYATEGDKVTIEVTPDQAYKLDDLTVTAHGKDVELTDNHDGTFSFTMPSADVKITATFAEDPDWTEPEEPATDVSDIFLDIAPDAWYKDAVQYAYDNGLMTGVSDTEFAPEATTTRAMIVSILARLEGVESAEAAGFADVDDEWYATAVNWAANVGVVNGYEDNTFKPNTAITREQLAAILMNYAAYKGEDVSNRADLASYTDQPSTWAEETMQWAVAEGLISGVTADTLQPQGAATRAQVAAILQRFLSE